MKFDLAPLLNATRLSIAQLADHLGLDRGAVYHWQHSGVPAARTDELAVKFGFVPYELWDDWLDWSLETADEALEKYRAKRREHMRLIRSTPEGLAATRQSVRKFRATHPGRAREQRHRYWLKHKEELRIKNRAHQAAYRARQKAAAE